MLEVYCNTLVRIAGWEAGWLAVSQYSRSVLWLGKGLLGESRYKICIVTEAASWLGAGLGVQGARGERQARARAERRQARRAQARGAQALGVQALGVQARRAQALGVQARRAQARGACGAGARQGRAAWARGLAGVVHLVHSACFWPCSTRYFS